MTLRAYWAASRQPRYSLVFAAPLLLLYEGLTALLPPAALAGVRNGADVLLRTLFVALGGRGGVGGFGLLLVGLGAWIVWRDRRRHPGPIQARIFLAMLAESVVYAGLFGYVVAALTTALLRPAGLALVQGSASPHVLPLAAQLVVSLGAGIYEELVFRVLLVSGLLWVATLLGWRRPAAWAGALVGSALIFSGFHYVGPLGDSFAWPSFTFRALAGLLLSGLYATRGFGIAAWTHALYDVGLALLGRF
jgi:membrane protease YdiL (CAAX protease family)